MRPSLSLLALIMVAASGCTDSTGPADGDEEGEFVVSGTVQNNTMEDIPAGARVVVAWVVTATSPDYTYVFGEGTIDADDGTFEVVFTAEPPAAALNAGALGVGIIAVTTNGGLSEGDDLGDLPDEQILGAAGDYGVIFVSDPSAAAESRGWSSDFDAGYGVGIGVPMDQSFDTFVPIDPSDVELIIDDLDNITFVNWT